jgi:cobalt-zinc-cadmium efflux system outer membrane protein
VADPDPAQWEPIAVAQRLDLAAAGKEWQALADALGVARDWRFLLAADVGASAERELDGVWVFGPSLGFELPIFNRRGAEIAALQSELRRAEHRLTALAVEIRGEVRSARSRMAFAREAAESYRDTLVPLRERVVALTQEAYNFMLVGQFELLQAKREEIEAYRGYVGAVRDYWIARTDLERAVGGRLDAEPTPASSFIAPTAATPTQPHVHHPPKENRP